MGNKISNNPPTPPQPLFESTQVQSACEGESKKRGKRRSERGKRNNNFRENLHLSACEIGALCNHAEPAEGRRTDARRVAWWRCLSKEVCVCTTACARNVYVEVAPRGGSCVSSARRGSGKGVSIDRKKRSLQNILWLWAVGFATLPCIFYIITPLFPTLSLALSLSFSLLLIFASLQHPLYGLSSSPEGFGNRKFC